METIQIRDAKASFSAVIAAAESGHPTIISRHGQPCAMVVPMEAGQRLYAQQTLSLAEYLLAMPEPLVVERDRTPMRNMDL